MVCAAAMSNHGTSVWVAVGLGMLAGLALGLFNGVLIAYYGLDAIVTTLGMSIALPGLMVLYTDGTSITHNLSPTLLNFGSFNWLGVPRMTFILVPIVLATWYVLECTEFGRHLFAIRSNPRSAHLVGINVARTVLISFAFSGLLAGVAGVLLTARAGSADATTGPSYLFPALAAVMLGVTTIRPGRPNVFGTMVGVFFVALTVSGLSLMGAASWAPSVINGGILVCAAGLAAWISRRRTGASRGM
jgi:ribose transport system permease protein